MATRQGASDFDQGFGIGGLSRHDPEAELSELIASGQVRIVEKQRTGPMPHGQLWEPCPICDDEPVCLDCGYCERHCRC